MPKLIFGVDTICPRCKRFNRRKQPYGAGVLDSTVGYARAMGYTIVKRWGSDDNAPCTVVCYNCNGRGLVR